MREIKFRGVTPDGKTVYGDLTHFEGNIYVDDNRVETFAQLCGYDDHGREVYEGDDVIEVHGFGEFTVELATKYGLLTRNRPCTLLKR